MSAVTVPLFPSLADPTEIKLSWALLHTQWLHLPKIAGTQITSDQVLGKQRDSETRVATLLLGIGRCKPCVSEQSFICDFSNCVWPSTIITTISGGVDVNYLSLNTKHNEMLQFCFQTLLPWTLNIIQLIKTKKNQFSTVILRDLHVLIISFN